MNLKKLGGLESGLTLCVDKRGYEHVLVVAKATFDIHPDGHCSLSDQQDVVTLADEHRGEPAASLTAMRS